MGMLVEGLNLIRDAWVALADSGELGTGTTMELPSDTDIETPIASTETSTTSTDVNQATLLACSVPGNYGSGEASTEFIWKTSSPEKALSRVTHGSHTYDEDGSYDYDTEFYWKGRRNS